MTVALLAIAGLLALSDLHWPYADEIMTTLDPFYKEEAPKKAWLDVRVDAENRVDREYETKKMAAMVKLNNRLKGWTQSHGCQGKVPPYSSRKDSRAWKFCADTDDTLHGVCGLINEKIILMGHERRMIYTGLVKGPCQFSEKFKLNISTPIQGAPPSSGARIFENFHERKVLEKVGLAAPH